MNERDGPRIKDEAPRGILNVTPEEARRGVARYWPSSDLAPFVEHYWIVRWDVAEPQLAETIPHPSVHMVVEPQRAEVVGVMRTRFSRLLEGRGRAVGTKFRPGAFRPFVRPPVGALTGKRVPVGHVFGPEADRLAAVVRADEHDAPAVAAVESFLRGLHPRADEAMALAGRMAERIAGDRTLTRVDQLVREFGLPLRRLQRLFREYVGVGPKWVIQRHRLLDAAERVAAGTVVAWAELALDLGYADQAHFIRDFKRLVGRSPAEYARDLARAHPTWVGLAGPARPR